MNGRFGPFAATIVDGKLYARGAANSKGDLVARLAAVEAYQKTFGKLPVALRFLVDGEDGLGSPSLYRFAAENPEMLAAEGCIWDEGYKDTQGAAGNQSGFQRHSVCRTARAWRAHGSSFKVGRDRAESGVAPGAGAGDDYFAEGRDNDRRLFVVCGADQ